MPRPALTVIGAGRLGIHLARRAAARNLGPVRLRSRRPATPDELRLLPAGTVRDSWTDPAGPPTALVVVAVQDGAIPRAAADLVEHGACRNAVVLHASGLLTADALAPCRAAGAAVGSWHPLQTFPDPGARTDLQWDGVACAVEGDRDALAAGFALARDLGMTPWLIATERKAEYHAAAALAGNLTHVLVAAAVAIADRCGLPQAPPDGNHLLAPLVESSVAAALAAPGLEQLTGAIARGDETTIRRHLEVLDDDLAEAYRALARLVGRAAATDWLD